MRVIVTGSNSGVGKATASILAAAGHHGVLACRTLSKAEQAAAEMTGDAEVCHLDLADLSSVRKFADSVESADVLVNNAGVLCRPLRLEVPARRQDPGPGPRTGPQAPASGTFRRTHWLRLGIGVKSQRI
jgi:NAD(P)-dependent dehydrogenase (short-subunit alcohol dehydrogenase family)